MNISTIKDCYGCMACVDKCPQQCIQTIQGELGHIYPAVNQNACIDCGLCLKVCPANNEDSFKTCLHTYAAWMDDEQKHKESSSGGIATAISELFIQKGYIVYGCAFNPKFTFTHIRCENLKDLERLKGSKYVQSDMKGVYQSIAKDFKHNKTVLFIGTPCQVAGVKNFFHKQTEQLYTIDLVCHGVPSVRMLQESLPQNILDQDFDNVSFRENTKYRLSIKKDASTIYELPINKSLYLKGFFKALYYRNSCYVCKYARQQRIGDITLGDFWGIDKKTITDDIKYGISLCLINTEKGNMIFNSIPNIRKIERPIQESLKANKQLSHPCYQSKRVKVFRKLYTILGFKKGTICTIPEIIIKNKLINLIKK